MALKVWNGSSWVSVAPKVWSGSAWTTVTNAYTWSGSAWQRFYPNRLKYEGSVTLDWYDNGTFAGWLYLSSAYGSATPSTLVDGKGFAGFGTVYDSASQAFLYNLVSVDGFSSNPGSDYLSEAVIDGTAFTIPAVGYNYSSGLVNYTDTSGPEWFSYGSGSPITVALNLYGS